MTDSQNNYLIFIHNNAEGFMTPLSSYLQFLFMLFLKENKKLSYDFCCCCCCLQNNTPLTFAFISDVSDLWHTNVAAENKKRETHSKKLSV